jgi:hypothetical protein
MRELRLNDIKARKALIFDASSIITLNMLGMAELLRELKLGFDGKFLITKAVYDEIVRVPSEIKKYQLKALMVKKIVDEGVLDVVVDEVVEKSTNEILAYANSLLSVNGEKIKIIHRGEASCIALYELLSIENENKAVVIDERTTRMLLEKPYNLAKLIENKIHKKISIDDKIARYFSNKKINVIRSAEILLIGVEKQKVKLADGAKLIDAVLYGAKGYGCSISDKEIEEARKLKI